MRFYITRHGETSANKEGRMQGWKNSQLNDFGIELAIETGKGLKGVKFDAAFSSPLDRAINTAKLMLEYSGNETAPVIQDERIIEIHMGDFEGKIISKEIPPEMINAFFVNPFQAISFPNGENITDVCKRTQEFIHEIAESGKYENVLVSSHGCAIRCMLNFMYENKEDFWRGHVPYNCSVTIVDYTNGVFSFVEEEKIYYDKDKCIDRYADVK